MLEADGDERIVLRQPFPGPQIEGDVAPAPVVDEELQRTVGFRGAVFRHTGLLEIARHPFAVDLAAGILGTVGMGMDRTLGDRPDGAQHLDLLVAQRFGIEVGRRLHGDQCEHLQQMTLHHVAQGAGGVVVAGPPLDAAGLGMGDLHMVDIVAVPQRLEHQVGEPEHQDVLHRLLAEVVVDAIELILLPVLVQPVIEDLGALEIETEGLFYHHPAPAALFPVEPDFGQAGGDRTEVGRADRHVEDHVGAIARIPFEVRPQGTVHGVVAQIPPEEAQPGREARPDLRIDAAPYAVGEPLMHLLAPDGVVPVAPPHAQDAGTVGQPAGLFQMIERRQELVDREIAGRAEDDEGAGLAAFTVHRPAPCGSPDARRRRCASSPAACRDSLPGPGWRSAWRAPG